MSTPPTQALRKSFHTPEDKSQTLAEEVLSVSQPATEVSDHAKRPPDATSTKWGGADSTLQPTSKEVVNPYHEENVNPQPTIVTTTDDRREEPKRRSSLEGMSHVRTSSMGSGSSVSKKKRTLKSSTRTLMYVSRMQKKGPSNKGNQRVNSAKGGEDDMPTGSTLKLLPIAATDDSESTTLPVVARPKQRAAPKTRSSLDASSAASVSMHMRSKTQTERTGMSLIKSAARSVLYASKLQKSKDLATTRKRNASVADDTDDASSIEMTPMRRKSSSATRTQKIVGEIALPPSPPAISADLVVNFTAQGKIDSISGQLPVKDVLKGLYRMTRWKTLQGCFLWLLFLGLIAVIFSLVHDASKIWEQQSALGELFLDEEIPKSIFKKNFHDIMSKGELWDWIDGVLVPGVYQNRWYNGRLKDDDKNGYIVENTMKIVGGVRIRQHRVDQNSCTSRRFVKFVNKTQPERCGKPYDLCPFDRVDKSCFSEYRKDLGPFWGVLADFINREHTAIDENVNVIPRYSSYNKSNGMSIPDRYIARKMDSDLDPAYSGFGIDGTYGYIGFYQDLPPANRSAAVSVLRDMKQELWLDDGTRAVAITFTVYNTMSRSATVCRFTIEFSESGRVYNRGKFYTFPLVVYGNSGASKQRTVLEVAALLLYVYFAQKELKKSCRMGCSTYLCKRKSSIIELAILAIFGVYFTMYYGFVYEILYGKTSTEFHVMSTVFLDLINLGWRFTSFTRIGGVSMVLGSVKIIKFIALSKQAMLLLQTLLAARNTLFAYTVFFVTLWIAFAYWGQSLYGDLVWQFSTFTMAMSALFRLMLADSELDYELLFRYNPEFTPYFYFLFQFTFLVLIMNLLIAILVSQFELVKDLSIREELWKTEVPPLHADVATLINIWTYRCRKRCFRDKMALQMTESIDEALKLYANEPEKWAETYAKSSEYWRGCEQWKYFNLLRGLAHIGKDSNSGPSVNLLDMLEKLYIQWKERADEAVKGGHISTTGRMPIACISASRLLLMISNAPPSEPSTTNRINTPRYPTNFTTSDKSGMSSSIPCCSKNEETPVERKRRIYEYSKRQVERTIHQYHTISDVVLVAPIISDADYWNNDEAVIGESLQINMQDEATANSIFKVRMSVCGKGEKWQTIFLDINGWTLYILTPVDKRIKTQHEVRRYERRSRSRGTSLASNTSLWGNGKFSRSQKTDSDIPGSTKAADEQDNTNMTWFGRDHESSPMPKAKYFDADGALWKKLTEGGRIRIVLDMLDLQQVQVDRIDLQLLTLYFEDSVGASYRFRFDSFERRQDFLIQVREIDQTIKMGHATEEEFDNGVNSQAFEGGGAPAVSNEAPDDMRRKKFQRKDSKKDKQNKSKTKPSRLTYISKHSKLSLVGGVQDDTTSDSIASTMSLQETVSAMSNEGTTVGTRKQSCSDVFEGLQVQYREATGTNRRNRRRSVMPGAAVVGGNKPTTRRSRRVSSIHNK